VAKRALIIANSTYEDDHFAALPAAAADAAELAAVLGDPDIGEFEVETLVDVGQRVAMRALESFFTRAGRDDLLLLHLSLHGWKDVRNRLFFVMRDTERDYPVSTAVASAAAAASADTRPAPGRTDTSAGPARTARCEHEAPARDAARTGPSPDFTPSTAPRSARPAPAPPRPSTARAAASRENSWAAGSASGARSPTG